MTDDPTLPPGWREAIAELRRRLDGARAMGGAERLARQRACGRLDARARIERLLDAGTFVELGALVGAEAGIAADGFVAGTGEIEGRVVQRPTGQRAMVLKQPVGPVAAFSPWNFPVNLMAKKIAPALAAGCVVISKPPEETPGCTSAIMRCIVDAGISGDVVQLVYGDPDMISRHLLGSSTIRKVSFTGSTAVGKHLMKLAADNVQRCPGQQSRYRIEV